jgi:hypothetical protein
MTTASAGVIRTDLPARLRPAAVGAIPLGDRVRPRHGVDPRRHSCVDGGLMRRRRVRTPVPRSAFAGFCFPPEVITVAVRW